MTALIVLGCILLFFIFLLSIKVKIIISYSEEVALTVHVLGIKIKILPAKKKKGPHSMSEKKAEKIKKKLRQKKLKKNEASRKKAAKKEEESKTPKPKKTLPEILYIIGLVRTLAAKVIKTFFKHLRIDIAKLKIVVATGDAASTAIAYGAITQSINLLFPILEEVKNFSLPKDTDIDVSVDYLSDGITADIRLGFALRVWHVFAVAFGALFKLIGYLIKNPRPKKKAPPESHKVGTKK